MSMFGDDGYPGYDQEVYPSDEENYDEAKAAEACEGQVIVGYSSGGTPWLVACGTYWGGDKQFCAPCWNYYMKRYPQGWQSYPGDVCQHGVYVGGCMEDFMCFQCEMGYDSLEPDTEGDDE